MRRSCVIDAIVTAENLCNERTTVQLLLSSKCGVLTNAGTEQRSNKPLNLLRGNLETGIRVKAQDGQFKNGAVAKPEKRVCKGK